MCNKNTGGTLGAIRARVECKEQVMAFSIKQLVSLRGQVNAQNIQTRIRRGKELSYIEGHYAVAEANRIFGFDGWDRETVEAKCVLSRELRGVFVAAYI